MFQRPQRNEDGFAVGGDTPGRARWGAGGAQSYRNHAGAGPHPSGEGKEDIVRTGNAFHGQEVVGIGIAPLEGDRAGWKC